MTGDVETGLAYPVVDRVVRSELIGQQVAVEVDHTGSAVVQ